MSDPENFINRWSRRKREAAAEDAEQKQADADESHAPISDEQTKADSRESAASPPAFDISSLPPMKRTRDLEEVQQFLVERLGTAVRENA